jgi:uncharacterized protein YcgL (UPF0745 family)
VLTTLFRSHDRYGTFACYYQVCTQGEKALDVYVYSSSLKNGYYLYLAKQDNFDVIPASIKPGLGTLTLALTFNLHESRRLATEDPARVLENLEKNGFHLQISDPLRATERLKTLSER